MAEIISMLRLLLTLSLAFAAEPGVKFVVTNKLLDYVNQVANIVLRKELQTMNIPDQSGSDDRNTWNVRNIRIDRNLGPYARISLNPGAGGVTLAISNFGVNLKLDWSAQYRIIHMASFTGSVDMSDLRPSLTLLAGLGEKNGRPSVFVKSCSCKVGVDGTTIYGGLAASMLNLFVRFIKTKIRNLLQDKICGIVIEQVNTRADQELSRMKVNVDIAKHFTLDYSLIRAPTITDKYTEFASKGVVYWKGNRQESPFTPAVVPAVSDFSKMLYVFVTEASANSFAYTAHNNGYLEYNVTVDKFPVWKVNPLDPTGQIKNKYPNSKLELRISSSIAPSVKFEEQKMTVAAAANVEVVVHKPDGAISPLTLRVNVSATIQPSVVNGKLTATITTYTFSIAVIKSHIGHINEQDLNKLIRENLYWVIIPYLNEYGEQGIPLPVTDIFQMYNSQLKLKAGYLQVETDVRYLN